MNKSVSRLIEDEHKAAEEYKESEKGKPERVKKVFQHIRPQEKEHAKELTQVEKKKNILAKRMK